MKRLDIESVIKDLIKPSAREEALKIMTKATPSETEEFYSYYGKDSLNVCCLVIDKIKNAPRKGRYFKAGRNG